MKPQFLLAAALVLATAAATSVLSQQAAVPTRIGFLDIKKAFETYRKHKDAMEQLKKKNDDFVATLKQWGGRIDAMNDKLNQLNSGTDEYGALEQQISVEKSNM